MPPIMEWPIPLFSPGEEECPSAPTYLVGGVQKSVPLLLHIWWGGVQKSVPLPLHIWWWVCRKTRHSNFRPG